MDFSLEKSKTGTISAILIFLTVLSQMPSFVGTPISRYLCLGAVLLLFLLAIAESKTVYIPKSISFLYISFAIFVALASLVNSTYFHSDHVYPMFLCLFVLIIGTSLSNILTRDDLYSIYSGFIYGTICICIDLFLNYFRGTNFDSYLYIYGSKNSVSQILFTALVLILYTKIGKKSILATFVYIFVGAFMFYLLLALKSRATLIAIPAVVVFFVFSKNSNKAVRGIVITIAIAIIVLLLFNQNVYDTVINQIVLNGRKGESLDIISSGRITMFERFFERIQGHWLFGIGASYIESYPFSVILNFGIIVGTMLIFFSLYPILVFFPILRSGNYSEHVSIVFTIAVSYWINSLFEQLAPFGPGCKCFFLWLMLGLYMGGNLAFIKETR